MYQIYILIRQATGRVYSAGPMRLTTYSDYTLRVLMYLALNRARLATITEISAAYGISKNHLMKVVHQLARAGVVESVRGPRGGIRLARTPVDKASNAPRRQDRGPSARPMPRITRPPPKSRMRLVSLRFRGVDFAQYHEI